MIRLLRWTLTWWHGRTWGVMLRTWRRGRLVGRDALGARYYQDKTNPARRWVVYGGETEATAVPPMWRMWLAGGLDAPPEAADAAQPWRATPAVSAARPRPAGWRRPDAPDAAFAQGAAVEAWTPDTDNMEPSP